MIKQDMSRNGFNDLDTGLGLRKLISKEMIKFSTESDYNGNEYYAYSITENGEKWLFENEDKLVYKKESNTDNDGSGDDG